MKKIYLLLLSAVLALVLIGCNTSEFKFDGKFTSYEVSVHHEAPMVTYVTVTIQDGKIFEYDIDVRQGTQEEVTGETTTYSYMWNESTKKELGDLYKMKDFGKGLELVDGEWVETGEKPENEWYEQAALMEEFLLENGVDSLETVKDSDDNERISNVAGVTIKDGGYSDLAMEAVELAKAGTFQAIVCKDDDLYIAKMMKSEDDDIESLMLDVLKGNPDGNTFMWSEKTKQEAGVEYSMKNVGKAYEFSDGTWVETDEKTSLEWFEQANLITDYIIANGWNDNLAALAGRGGTLDGTTLLDDLAGATIHTQTYYDVLKDLFDKVG